MVYFAKTGLLTPSPIQSLGTYLKRADNVCFFCLYTFSIFYKEERAAIWGYDIPLPSGAGIQL